MTTESALERLEAEINLEPRCGNCRRFPGNNQVCEERGRSVTGKNTVKKYCYEAMTAGELQARREEYNQRLDVKAKQKEYFQRLDVKAKTALKFLTKLRDANPELYKQLLKEATA